MKTIFILLFAVSASAQTLSDYTQFIERWEGRRHALYTDSRGNVTIGVGFHMIGDTDKIVRKMFVINGKEKLTDKQIDRILSEKVTICIGDVRTVIPNFDTIPYKYKLICADLRYQLGPTGFRKFKRAIAAIKKNDFDKFRLELRQSLWYIQSGNRGKHHVSSQNRRKTN